MPSQFLGQCRPPKTFDHTMDEMLRRMLYGTPQAFSQTLEQLVEAQIAVVRPPRYCFTDAELAGTAIRLRDGIDYVVEEQADDLLTASRKDNKRISDRDWLTKEQLALRIQKEVYNENGFPDSSLVSGMYRRAYSPLAGRRPNGRKSDDA